MSWQVGAFALLGLALAAGFAWYERRRPDARVVALVATLAAFAALGRIAFAALPNIKPTTDIVLISGYALGAGPGFVVGALAALSSNFFFGQGPWTPWQMAGWGTVGLSGAWLALATRARPEGRPIGRGPLALACGIIGFGFTALQDVGDWVNYSDHSARQLTVYVGKGMGFDAVHAIGCVAFALAFGPALARSVARFAARLDVSWRPPVSVAPVAVLLAGALALTAASTARSAASSSAAGYLSGAQNSDGGFGASPGQASSPLYSGWAALGLASAGTSPARLARDGHSLAGYLLASARNATDPGSLERTILALHASGLPVSGLVARLTRDIGRDGAISDQVNLTSFAVLALRSAGAEVPARTTGWLAAQNDADGGFNFGPAGGTSDVDDTGAVLEALRGVETPGAARSRRRAIAYLIAHQGASGGFPSQPGQGANAQSTAWAVQGLVAAGAPSGVVDRSLGYLRSLTAGDGHIRYSRASDATPVWVTGEALMALERKPLPIAPVPVTTQRIGVPPTDGVRESHAGRGLGAGRSATARRDHGRGANGGGSATRSEARFPATGVAALATDAGIVAALALAPIGLG